RQSIVPGNFIAFTTVEPGKSIDKWERINESNYFFPSAEVMSDHREDAVNFANFKDRIDRFFDNYVGIVGRGRYKSGQLQELTIEINLQSNGKAEIIAMTQFITAQLENSFHPSLPVFVYLNSLQGAESIIVRHSNEEPFVHVYR
ncbi:MAG: CamS family sex pheromone protein, partial [Bacillaceae bacterium]|nr:CamS family sex pheromone protein [Bacillaceae bacterium]